MAIMGWSPGQPGWRSLEGAVGILVLVVAMLCPTTATGTAINLPSAPEDCFWSVMPTEETNGGRSSIVEANTRTHQQGPSSGAYLTCHLSSINSRLERTNFSVIPNEITVGLKVICHGGSAGQLDASRPAVVGHLAGRLEPRGFSSLSKLQDLDIEGCALDSLSSGAFEGLSSLRHLSIKSANMESSALRIDCGSFGQLGETLEDLDLSHNQLSAWPLDELCQLKKLKHLKMSYNQLATFPDINSTCLQALESLDISSNELTSLSSDSVRLSNLTSLNLSFNLIRHLSKYTFSPATMLSILDISNNQISEISQDSDMFKSLPLQQLNLANNTLSKVPVNLLKNQKHLEELDLSGNRLTILEDNFTQDLFSLMRLDLSDNQLVNISADFLRKIPNIQVLNLANNNLAKGQLAIPSALIHLQELDLSLNQLEKVNVDFFDSGLGQLTHLNLARNRLSSIHSAAFRNTTKLLVLDLSENMFTQVPEALKYLDNLQTLDIGRNRIAAFDGKPFTKMSALWRLQLNGNLIRNFSQDALSGLDALQVLDLSANQVSVVEKGTFNQCRLLRAVRLDANHLREIDGLFSHLTELIWLNVSDNQIGEFDYAMVPRTLSWLDISHNLLQQLGNYFDLGSELDLSYLNAGFNRLTTIAPSSLPDSLETILLNDNAIKEVHPFTLYKKKKLEKLDLSVNEMTTIPPTALKLSQDIKISESDIPTVSLGGNPIICDCNMQWFKSVNNRAHNTLTNDVTTDHYPHIVDLESIYCRLVYTTERTFVPLVEARNEEFLCAYETHCFSLCQCCQFDSCDCEMTCPEGCTCYHDAAWTENIIQCSSAEKAITAVPDTVPMDATQLLLDGNNLPILHSHSFIGRKNLRSLYLNNSNVGTVENQTFNGLKSMVSLHLEDNKLTTLNGFEFSGLNRLRELYLQNNLIASISEGTFKGLKSLELIFLQGNAIIDFPVWQLALNPYLVAIRLSENLFSCDCNYISKFRGWLNMATIAKVQDAAELVCVRSDRDRKIHLMNDEENLCKDSVQINHRFIGGPIKSPLLNHQEGAEDVTQDESEESTIKDYLPMMIGVLASFAFLLLVFTLVFIFRHNLQVWIYSRTGVRMFKSLESKLLDANIPANRSDKLFDAYISYSPVDDAYVRQVLAPELENGTNNGMYISHNTIGLNNNLKFSNSSARYRLCLHHRDLPGMTNLSADHQLVNNNSSNNNSQLSTSEIVIKAAESSQRTIIILSNNYLRTEWSRYDLRSGILQSVKTNPKKMILIVGAGCGLDGSSPLDNTALDPNLRLLLKNNIVLNWGEQLFWEKLHFSLPDKSNVKTSGAIPGPQSPVVLTTSMLGTTNCGYVNNDGNSMYHQQAELCGGPVTNAILSSSSSASSSSSQGSSSVGSSVLTGSSNNMYAERSFYAAEPGVGQLMGQPGSSNSSTASSNIYYDIRHVARSPPVAVGNDMTGLPTGLSLVQSQHYPPIVEGVRYSPQLAVSLPPHSMVLAQHI